MLTFEAVTESWPIAGRFTISRGSKTAADVVVVTLERDGIRGRGECVPYARYRETVPQVLEALEQQRKQIARCQNFADIAALDLPYAARNALDCALWDVTARQAGRRAWEVAGLSTPKPLTTAYTLSLDTPEAMAAAAKTAASRPLLKLKLGGDADSERLAAIREAVPKARLIVDANEGWTADIIEDRLAACQRHGVELVEQPLPAGNDEVLRGLPRQTLICADESVHGIDTLPGLVGKYDAINIKLDKTGGLTPALALARAARDQGLTIMVGCMLATSLAMAPATLVAQFASYVDLDGPLLLQKDRGDGLVYDGGLMHPPVAALWG
ncbi:MAG: dipeptide epimerase [Proteobacteria bacterium]|nr:dipeptide epimerase [Pseudomonadota bacterium]